MGLPVDARCPSTGDTPLLLACRNSNVSAVQLLCAQGADPNLCSLSNEDNDAKDTPLYVGVCQGDAEIVQCLLAHGATPVPSDTST